MESPLEEASAEERLKEQVKERLQEIFRRVFNDPRMLISAELSAWDVPGWDSLANMQIMLDVESEFGIRLSSGEILKLNCVGDLLALILSKSSENASGAKSSA